MVAFLQDHAYAAATGPSTGPPTGPPDPLPAPLIPSNYEHGSQCAINEDLFTLVQPSPVTPQALEFQVATHS